MSDHLHSALHRHGVFIFIRMLILQLFALSFVAVSIGLVTINQYQESVYDSMESNITMTIESLQSYGTTAAEEAEIYTDEAMTHEHIQYILDKVGEEAGQLAFLFDSNGSCIACSSSAGISPENVSIAASMMYITQTQGSYSSEVLGKFNPNEKRPVICKGNIFAITEPDGTETEYFLFTNSFTDQIETFIRWVLITGACAVTIMLVIYSAFIYRYVARNLIIPDTVFARITQRYAKGDYSEMLEPESFSTSTHQDTARSINQIVSNLKKTSEQQSDFVSNVSHELRTPMTIISGYVDGILDGTIPKEKRTEYLYIVSQEMQRLKILISSMLNLTKFEAGTIQIKHELFSINDLIFRTILMFSNRLEMKNVEVTGLDGDTVRIYGDRDLISQVVYNLTENAVKFVNTGGTISFRLEENKDTTVFAIRNTGPGIPVKELDRIFDRFYKSDFSRSQDKTGLGLGLNITHRIAMIHEAQIKVSSEENVFTQFEVIFPKKPSAENAES